MPDLRLRRAAARACTLLACATPLAGWAQTPPLDSLLGADEALLQATFPQAQHLSKPRLGPRGLRGQWAVPTMQLAGLPFEAVFFFRNKQLQRIEQTWGSPTATCSEQDSFTPLSRALQARYGNTPVLDNSMEGAEQQASAAWRRDELEVVAHFSKAPGRCTLRVVYQARETKDASEL